MLAPSNVDLVKIQQLLNVDEDDPQVVAKAIDSLASFYQESDFDSVAPILPLLLNLEGKPFTLRNHFPMEPFYTRKNIPPYFLLKCGRQISKSTSLAAQGVIRSAMLPNLHTIFVAPLFEQVKRFSNNVVRPFIETSPIKHLLIGEGFKKDQNVFQRNFLNGSKLFFTYAYLDAERARGIAGDQLVLDEVQDTDWELIPVLEACLDASEYGFVQMSGTPKTTANTIHRMWEESSQAHWIIKCNSCSKYNIASLEFHLDKMVQEKGLSCAFCSALLNTRQGFWYHMFKDRRHKFPGLHVPQPIMPMHCENAGKWFRLYSRKQKWPTYRYHNEVLGETSDVGTRLITRTKLQEIACLPWDLNKQQAISMRKEYQRVMLGIDWSLGGGGQLKTRRGQLIVERGTPSYTVPAVVGFKAGSNDPHLLYTERISADMPPHEEVKYILSLFNDFSCMIMAHDYGGAGYLRESMLVQAGLPTNKIMPCMYGRWPAAPIVNGQQTNARRARWSYLVDKTRSLALLCATMNAGMVKFPRWSDYSEMIYLDFLALVETWTSKASGIETYLITQDPAKPSDFVHAFNFACIAHWHSTQVYPQLADQFGIQSSANELSFYQDMMSNW